MDIKEQGLITHRETIVFPEGGTVNFKFETPIKMQFFKGLFFLTRGLTEGQWYEVTLKLNQEGVLENIPTFLFSQQVFFPVWESLYPVNRESPTPIEIAGTFTKAGTPFESGEKRIEIFLFGF